MNKLLCIPLVVLLTASSYPLTAAADAPLSADQARDYANAIEDYLTETEYHLPDGDRLTDLLWVDYAEILDMNGDNIPELALIALPGAEKYSTDDPVYRCPTAEISLWTWRDEQAVLISREEYYSNTIGLISLTRGTDGRRWLNVTTMSGAGGVSYENNVLIGPDGVLELNSVDDQKVKIENGVTTPITAQEYSSLCRLVQCGEMGDSDLLLMGGKTAWEGSSTQPNPADALRDRLLSLAQPAQPAVPTDFTDVKKGEYFYNPVRWALEERITVGTSATTFSPQQTCTNAHILTFLWRANGSPRVGGTNPFTDLTDSDYYYDAALWAHKKGIIAGSQFHPHQPCSRLMTVMYLWRLAGEPSAPAAGKFTDVPAGYSQSAVDWALHAGITVGTGEDTFSPDQTCTRGQIVTFLWRALAG